VLREAASRPATEVTIDVLRSYTPQLLSVLRIMSGLPLWQHGTGKYLSMPIGPMNNASPMTMRGAAGVLELIGGPLLILGLFTRPTAFILSGLTAVACFYAHAPDGFFPILNGGALAALDCFLFLFLAAAHGAWTACCAAAKMEAGSHLPFRRAWALKCRH